MSNRRTILSVAVVVALGAAAMGLLWRGSMPISQNRPNSEGSAAQLQATAADERMVRDFLRLADERAPTGFPPLERFDEALETDFAARVATADARDTGDDIATTWVEEQLIIWNITPADQRGPALARSMQEFAERAMAQSGNDAWDDAGAELAARFATSLRTAADSCDEQTDLEATWLCMTRPGAAWHNDLIGIGGDFLEFGFRTGILTPEAGLTISEPMIRAIFLYRWYNSVTGVRPVEQSLTRDEYRAFLRWRIEHAAGVAAERRHQLAFEFASAFPDESDPPNADTLALTAEAAGVAPPAPTTEQER
jgi:hypothetical protein